MVTAALVFALLSIFAIGLKALSAALGQKLPLMAILQLGFALMYVYAFWVVLQVLIQYNRDLPLTSVKIW